jgi:hypothetical protein
MMGGQPLVPEKQGYEFGQPSREALPRGESKVVTIKKHFQVLVVDPRVP